MSKTLRVPFSGLGLLVAFLSGSFAGTAGAREDSAESVVGQVFLEGEHHPSARLLVSNGPAGKNGGPSVQRHHAQYVRGKDSTVMSEEVLVVRDGRTLVSYTARSGESGETWGVAAKDSGDRVVLTTPGGKSEESDLKIADVVVGPMIPGILRREFAKIVAGGTIEARMAVPDRGRILEITLSGTAKPCPIRAIIDAEASAPAIGQPDVAAVSPPQAAQNCVEVNLRPTSSVLALVAPTVTLTLSPEGDVLEFSGPLPIRTRGFFGWQGVSGKITFPNPSL